MKKEKLPHIITAKNEMKSFIFEKSTDSVQKVKPINFTKSIQYLNIHLKKTTKHKGL